MFYLALERKESKELYLLKVFKIMQWDETGVGGSGMYKGGIKMRRA